jgi:hypothetical protein
MSALSNYLEDALLSHTLGISALTAPTVYLALFTTDPTDADTGTEVTGSGYAREAISFALSGTGEAQNSSEETFTASGGNFGTVTHIGLYDASTSGNLLYHGSLAASRLINDGESLVFSVGDITITLA